MDRIYVFPSNVKLDLDFKFDLKHDCLSFMFLFILFSWISNVLLLIAFCLILVIGVVVVVLLVDRRRRQVHFDRVPRDLFPVKLAIKTKHPTNTYWLSKKWEGEIYSHKSFPIF